MMERKAVALLITFLMLSACQFNANLTTLDSILPQPPAIQTNKLISLENVSGSTGYVVTPVSGYKVKQTAGVLINKQVVTTPNGYKVYLHASGRITSEELSR